MYASRLGSVVKRSPHVSRQYWQLLSRWDTLNSNSFPLQSLFSKSLTKVVDAAFKISSFVTIEVKIIEMQSIFLYVKIPRNWFEIRSTKLLHVFGWHKPHVNRQFFWAQRLWHFPFRFFFLHFDSLPLFSHSASKIVRIEHLKNDILSEIPLSYIYFTKNSNDNSITDLQRMSNRL